MAAVAGNRTHFFLSFGVHYLNAILLYFNSEGKSDMNGFFTMVLLLIESCVIVYLIVFLVEAAEFSRYSNT
jgi:hypothetical protein